MITGEVRELSIGDLKPLKTDNRKRREPGAISDEDWAKARERRDILDAHLATPRPPKAEVAKVALALDCSVSSAYRLIADYKELGTLEALLPKHPNGGRGKKRLKPESEEVLELAVAFYKSPLQRTIKDTKSHLDRMCQERDLKPPHLHTLRARISEIPPKTKLEKRAHKKKAADTYHPHAGHFDLASAPLSVVQIDHTLLDVQVVDSENRETIGRPWLTVAFDVCTRMILGFFLSLDPPSANSVGMCLLHAILPKEAWLAERGIEHQWPCWGFPTLIHVDHGKDFKGKMLRLAAEIYHATIQWRRCRWPPDGGHIERCLGTQAIGVHALRGTTQSNPIQRGDYDAEKEADKTLPALEKWLANHILGKYHNRYHKGIKKPPLQRWNELILGNGKRPGIGIPPRPADEKQLRLHLRPFQERTVQKDGVHIGNITYYDDVLCSFINARDEKGRKKRFIFRTDPHDVRTVEMWDETTSEYFTIPATQRIDIAIARSEVEQLQRQEMRAGRKLEDLEAIERAERANREIEEQELQKTRVVRKTKAIRRKQEGRRLNAQLRVVNADFTPAPIVLPATARGYAIEEW
ncbi:MAG: transposase family protein [Vulcanimicrobiaceae bacterium]|jgi:putative transposase